MKLPKVPTAADELLAAWDFVQDLRMRELMNCAVPRTPLRGLDALEQVRNWIHARRVNVVRLELDLAAARRAAQKQRERKPRG